MIYLLFAFEHTVFRQATKFEQITTYFTGNAIFVPMHYIYYVFVKMVFTPSPNRSPPSTFHDISNFVRPRKYVFSYFP